MTDKEKIKKEIERRIENLKISLDKNCVTEESKLDIRGNITTLYGLLKFIDSLPEEFASVENDCTTCINDKGCVNCVNGNLYESAMRNDKYSCILEEPASEDRINECPHWEKYYGCETSPMNNCDSCPHAKWVEVKEEKKTTMNDIRELPKQNNSKKSYYDKSLVKEKPANEDLEEFVRYYLLNNHVSPLNDILHQADLKVEMQYHKDIENAFKAGAEWQKQQMMKDAVDCVFGSRATSAFVDDFPNIEIGDKIKIIIVKED